MSNQIPKLLGVISGSDKLEACLQMSELTNVTDVMNIDEKTIQQMEKYIQKKCLNLPVNERRKYLDEFLVNHPEMFMLAPGLSQRIINNCNKISTIFQTIPSNQNNVALVASNLVNQQKSILSNKNAEIKLKCLENVLKSDKFYGLNQHQICFTDRFHDSTVAIQRFSLDSRPINNVKINNNASVPALSDGYINRFIEDKSERVTRETGLNPPTIDTNAMETTEFTVSSNICADKQRATTTNNIYSQNRPICARQSAPFRGESTTPISALAIKKEPAEPQQLLLANTESNHQPRQSKSRVNPIEYYYNKIADDSNRMFHNCLLVPRRDFDVEFNAKGKTDTKPCAHFVCYNCRQTSKSKAEKRLKFYLTSKGAIINSNIINHLKIHFKLKGDV